MSKISTAYDAIVTQIGTTLSTHKRLSNPYSVERNPEPILSKGYGVRIGSGSNPKLIMNKISITRDFTVVLTRQFYATQNDAASKAEVEKDLMEDQVSLIQAFRADTTLSGVVADIEYVGDAGIGSVFPEKGHFLVLETTFQATYLEALT